MRQTFVRAALVFAAVFLCSLLLFAGVILLCAAFFIAVSGMTSLPVAVALTALFPLAAALGICGLLVDRARQVSAPVPRVGAPRASGDDDVLAGLGNLTGAKLGAMVENHPRKAALVSLAAGFAVGASPELRKSLQRVLASL